MTRTDSTNRLLTKTLRILVIATRIRTMAFVIVMIGGCGDGYDVPVDVIEDPGSETQTGYLSASATSGVSYETATQSGVTGEDGEFVYQEGESVRFFLRDTTLGEVPGQRQVTAFDLAGIQALTTGFRGFAEKRTEVSHAASIATLLQTLDFDGDPSNGFEITPEVASLFDGVEVDLSRDLFDFTRERTFRTLLNRANDEGLLATYRAPRGRIAVMEHLYAELGIAPGFYAPLSMSTDSDADGAPDTLTEYAFQERSTIELETVYGSVLSTSKVTKTFDDHGNVVTRLHEESRVITGYEESTFDADGNPLIRSSHADPNGPANSTTTFFHNMFGELMETDDDAFADGLVDRIETFDYDERGNRIRHEINDDADGSPNRVELQEWNEKRSLIGLSIDAEADGTFETVLIVDYDEDGRRTRETRYVDGLESEIKEWEYDARGLETFYGRDDDADGAPNWLRHSHYDEHGRLISQESDDDGDGEIDAVETWTRDANGNELRYEEDSDNDGVADLIDTYEYDTNGNRTRVQRDRNADGTPDLIVAKNYTPAGWSYFFAR
jgi:hypothetical protein